MSDFIRYYDDMLTKDECNDLINHTKSLHSEYSEIKNKLEKIKSNPKLEINFTSTIKETLGNNNRFYYRVLDTAYTEKQIELIDTVLEKTYNNYQKDFTLDSNYDNIVNNWKVHYNPVGGYINWHNDLGGKSGHEQSWHREMVFILYLNDMEEGELKLKYFSDVNVMPKAGRILVMPTAWPWIHKADRLFEEKFILTGFFYNKQLLRGMTTNYE